eukprot:TRINITY_DN79207_c0_g1_i1.p1 TRINITY_DN79207_c0_g1~~TRINITY_DN79207_c0_g1_i1.p1  ORF type:complete len:213 (+),score=30.31 TRINITY_DN79207_c0_g1_i1:194-832(+)
MGFLEVVSKEIQQKGKKIMKSKKQKEQRTATLKVLIPKVGFSILMLKVGEVMIRRIVAKQRQEKGVKQMQRERQVYSRASAIDCQAQSESDSNEIAIYSEYVDSTDAMCLERGLSTEQCEDSFEAFASELNLLEDPSTSNRECLSPNFDCFQLYEQACKDYDLANPQQIDSEEFFGGEEYWNEIVYDEHRYRRFPSKRSTFNSDIIFQRPVA